MKTKHDFDCTIYSALINGSPEDGICTCGYGWSLVRKGDYSEMYSEERARRPVEQNIAGKWIFKTSNRQRKAPQ